MTHRLLRTDAVLSSNCCAQLLKIEETCYRMCRKNRPPKRASASLGVFKGFFFCGEGGGISIIGVVRAPVAIIHFFFFSARELFVESYI